MAEVVIRDTFVDAAGFNEGTITAAVANVLPGARQLGLAQILLQQSKIVAKSLGFTVD